MVLLAPQPHTCGVTGKVMHACSTVLNKCTNDDMKTTLSVDDTTDIADEVVVLNIGGSRYEITRHTLNRLPSTKLAKLDRQSHIYRKDKDEYFYDRDPGIFSSVLNYYRTGQLHIPRESCSIQVKQELDFWEIKDTDISDCCWLQYQAQWDQRETLARFDINTIYKPPDLKVEPTCWQRFKAAGWSTMEDPYSSTFGKVFGIVSVSFVLLSLVVFVLETHPYFREEMTADDYAEYYDVPLEELMEKWLGDRPPGSPSHYWWPPPPQEEDPDVENAGERVKRWTNNFYSENEDTNFITLSYDDLADLVNYAHKLLEGRQRPTHNQSPIRTKREVGEFPIVSVNGTNNTWGNTTWSFSKDGNLGTVNPVLQILNKACAFYFTMELIARFIFCPRVYLFFSSILNIVDIVALIPFYITFTINYFYPETKYENTAWLDFIMLLRTTRVFRTFRLMKHNRGLQVLLYTLRASCREMLLMVMFLLIGVLMYSSLIYLTDQDDEKFISIPHSFWWAIVTMTTVGYGDMVPSSDWGYFVGSCCAVSGVLMVAFTVPIMVNNFILFYQHVQYRKNSKTCAGTLAKKRKFSNRVANGNTYLYYVKESKLETQDTALHVSEKQED